MQLWTLPNSGNISVAVAHKVSRHRDVLSDYAAQFKRVVSKLRKNRNRFDLLGSIHNDIQQYHQKNSTNESLLNSENDKLRRT